MVEIFYERPDDDEDDFNDKGWEDMQEKTQQKQVSNKNWVQFDDFYEELRRSHLSGTHVRPDGSVVYGLVTPEGIDAFSHKEGNICECPGCYSYSTQEYHRRGPERDGGRLAIPISLCGDHSWEHTPYRLKNKQ